MEILLGAVCVCLLLLSAVLLRKYLSLKRNIRSFSRELEKLKDSEYSQPLKVSDFDKDIVGLAVKVNEHTDIQRKLAMEYEESRRQLSTVISGISHDFRTPLTASLGYLQMIEKSGGLTGKNAEYLSIAMEKNRYLKELSDEFFELTKTESGGEEPDYEEINLSNILTETVLEQHDWISQRNISADIDIADGIIISTDSRSLTRILNNLMSNSEKYTFDRFCVTLCRSDEHIRLRVENTVADSASVDIGRVFEPFYRMASRTSGGSGLGLYVVKLLCGRLGWDVAAEINGDAFAVRIII